MDSNSRATLYNSLYSACLDKYVYIYTHKKALFADDSLLVGAGNVVGLHAVLVEVVQDAQAPLVAFSVVGLGPAQAAILSNLISKISPCEITVIKCFKTIHMPKDAKLHMLQKPASENKLWQMNFLFQNQRLFCTL